MEPRHKRLFAAAIVILLLLLAFACSGGAETTTGGGGASGGGSSGATPEGSSGVGASGGASGAGASGGGASSSGSSGGTSSGGSGGAATGALPDAMERGLLLASSQFIVENGAPTARPGPARLDLVWREGGTWHTETIEDPDSIVFHKAMVYDPPGAAAPGILTLGGGSLALGAAGPAMLKLWRHGADGWTAEVLWTEAFGGRFNRMRDAEIAPLYGTSAAPGGVVGDVLAVATHDMGVVGVVSPATDGTWNVSRIDHTPSTFVHEIEIGDLDGNGVPEVYATPSEPNDLDGGPQHGIVVRYEPGSGAGRTVVADLGNRHAKEILVDDVDGDGRDELYVAVEALTSGTGDSMQIVEPVEIRRYDAGAAPDSRVVIATIDDRLTRFLTVGDVDGDGHREMVAAAFRTGLWILRPGSDAHGEWSIESIARDSSGFEHAALLTDLDGDGTDELYVGSDDQGELRRYVWSGSRWRSDVLSTIDVPRSRMTWNLMPFPVSLMH